MYTTYINSYIHTYTNTYTHSTQDYDEEEGELFGEENDLDPSTAPAKDPCREALYNLGVLELTVSSAKGVHKHREASKWFALAAEKAIMDTDNAVGRFV